MAGTQPTIGTPSPTTKDEELDCEDKNLGRETQLHSQQHPFREWAHVLREKELDPDTGRYVGTPVESLVDHLGHHAAPFADEWAAASVTQLPKPPSVVPFVKISGVHKSEWHLSTPPVLLNSASAAWSVFNPRLQELWVRLKLETSLNVIEIIQLNKSEYLWASFPVDTGSLPPDFHHSRQWFFPNGGALLIPGLKGALAAGTRYSNDQVKLKFSGTEGKLLNVSLVCYPGDNPSLDDPFKHFVYSCVAIEGSRMLPRLQMSVPHFELCSSTLKSVLQGILVDDKTVEGGHSLAISIDKSLSLLRVCLTSSEELPSIGEATVYLPGKLLMQSNYAETSSACSFGSHGKHALKRFSYEYLDDSVSVTCSSKYFSITAGSSKRSLAPSASISIFSGQ